MSKISIIVPFYNGNQFLPTLLVSLNNSYEQSARRLQVELIIVLDSMETTIEQIQTIVNECITQAFVVSIFKNKQNMGVDKARDIGTSYATGEYITFIDQDDFVDPLYFSIIENRLQNSNSAVFLLNGKLINLSNKRYVSIYYFKPNIDLKRIIYNNPILSPCFWLLKKSLLNEYVCFTLPFTNYKGVDDWYFSIRLFLSYPQLNIEYIKERVIYYSIHENNYSHNLREQIDGAIAVLRSLKNANTMQQKYIRQRIKTLEFAKLFYLQNKLLSILKHPCIFLLFLYHYMSDKNRMIRFAGRYIHRVKIKRIVSGN